MKFTSNFNSEKKLVIVRVTGEYRPQITGMSIKKIFNEIRQWDFNKALFDFRDATVILNTIITYHRPSTYLKVGFKRTTKYAYLFNELTDDVYFLENVMYNNGFQFKVFTDYQSAMNWLVPSGLKQISMAG